MSEDQSVVPVVTSDSWEVSMDEYNALNQYFKEFLKTKEGETLLSPVDDRQGEMKQYISQAKGVLLYAQSRLRKQDLSVPFKDKYQLLSTGFDHISKQLLDRIVRGSLSLEALVEHPLLSFDENGFLSMEGLDYTTMTKLVNEFSLVYAVEYL